MSEGRLAGRVAVVTGGAGGIGGATARRLAREGARVVVVDLDGERAEKVAAEVAGLAVVADVAHEEGVERYLSAAVERFGRVDLHHLNAGIPGSLAPPPEVTTDDFDRVMAVNVRGSFLLAKHALAVMRDGGSMIFNSSIVGLMSDATIAGYATSKHAIVGLMRTAVREVAGRGIRVNSIHPGPVDNEFQHRIEVSATGEEQARAAELFEERIPLARHATPDEIARTVLFLASDDSSFVTATTLSVDGGLKG
jgi:NAD(P)-dependent dehydrogenase (short-subunit alcohol dehydrogenase family)